MAQPIEPGGSLQTPLEEGSLFTAPHRLGGCGQAVLALGGEFGAAAP